MQRGSNPANQTTDQRGLSRIVGAQADIGAFESSETVPVANLANALHTVAVPGGTSYSIAVRYEDETGIDVSTLDLNDITISGPGFAVPQQPIAQSITGSGQSVTVTYTIPAPGGTFDNADNGVYSVNLLVNQVRDLESPTPLFVRAESLGGFRVALPFSIVVDENTDIDDGNTAKGYVSPREAIRLTNDVPNTTDTITFDPMVFNTPTTIKLAGGTLNTEQLVLIGPGAGLLTLDAVGNYRHFTCMTVDGSAMNISGLTMINGSASVGGAIYSSGPLTLSNVAVRNCWASDYNFSSGGGVYASGFLTISNSAFVGNGTQSANFYGPAGSTGGAISAPGGLFLESSTISGNTARGHYYYTYFGNYYSPGSSGGIAAGGTVTIRNSTISSNSSASAGSISGTNLLVQNSTITANTGGGISASTVSLESSIVSKNVAAFAPDIIATTVSAKTSSIFSLSGITTFNNLGGNRPVGEDPKLGPLADNGGPAGTHRLLADSPCINAGSNPANLTLDQRGFPRVMNGVIDIGAIEDISPTITILSGPGTITSAGSTSFSLVVRYDDETGINLASIDLNDIRVTGPGYSAPQAPSAVNIAGSGKSVTVTYTVPAPGGVFDYMDYGLYTATVLAKQIGDLDTPVQSVNSTDTSGSFLVAIPVTLTVDEASDIDDGNTSPGHLSLREAVRLTNSTIGTADTITFSPAVFNARTTVKLQAGEYAITDPLSIIGPATSSPILDAGNKSRLFNIDLPGTANQVKLSYLTLVNGTTDGSIPYSGFGGAIQSLDALNLSTVMIRNCQSIYSGGGVFVNGAPLTIQDCLISDNKAGSTASTGGVGGGIAVYAGMVVIERTSILNNQATGSGGGISVQGTTGALQLSNSTIANNKVVNGFGGGVYFGTQDLGLSFIRNSTISGNSASTSTSGGGVMISNYSTGVLAFANCTITGNSCGYAGGGIQVNTGNISLNSTIVAGNTAPNSGPDIWFAVSKNIAGNNNLISVANSGGFSLNGSGNKTGSKSSPLNAKLGPLAFYGGPTQTHSLLTGSPAINNGNNVLNLVNDQRGNGYVRASNGTADIGAFENQTVPAAKVSSLIINNGALQRSRLTRFNVNISDTIDVTLFQNPGAITLTRTSGGAGTVVTTGSGLIVTPGAGYANSLTLTFANINLGGVQFGSLADGQWQLGIPSLGYVSALNDPAFRRVFGDSDNSGSVDALDFANFGNTFGSTMISSDFDFDINGTINALDFAEFGNRFGVTL